MFSRPKFPERFAEFVTAVVIPAESLHIENGKQLSDDGSVFFVARMTCDFVTQ